MQEPRLPGGTVTLLFTDIEGSTQLLHELGDSYAGALAIHRALLRDAFARHNGFEVDTQGDAFFVAFARAHDALAAAVDAQLAIEQHEWPGGARLRVRMGLHTGEPIVTGEGYAGVDLHRGARIAACGHGGQLLLSQTTHALLAPSLPAGVTLHDLGAHRLKDLAQNELIWQVCAEGLREEFPALNSINNRPHNLPLQATALIGREAEVFEVSELLRLTDVRLLTLTGVGGTGKTRLALASGGALLDHFDDGVFFVPLAAISDPELVVTTMAQVLGLDRQAASPLNALCGHLKTKKLLLLLDNFEQVVVAAGVVAQLMGACPDLKVLVTSRIPLHIAGEREFSVLPLALPGRKPPPPLEQISQFSAVRLFIERAQSVKPNFEINNDNATAVAEICSRLDGLPLAIELAAARSKMLSPHAMLARLESSLSLLTGGSRDAPARHQTLRGAIAWSYDLLEVEEAQLFRRLGVFVGGFTLEAAAAVCYDGNDVFELVCSLVDKSLLRQTEQDDGESRFSMLETVREFAAERSVENSEIELLRGIHARYFSAQVGFRYDGMDGEVFEDSILALTRLEIDNIRAALTFLLTSHPLNALELSNKLRIHWERRENAAGLQWLKLALDRNEDAPPYLRGKTYELIATLAENSGSYGESQLASAGAAELFNLVGDVNGRCKSLMHLAWLAALRGELMLERAYMEEALACSTQITNAAVHQELLHSLGDAAMREGEYARAKQLFGDGLKLLEPQHTWAIAFSHQNMGLAHYLCGEVSAARPLIERSYLSLLERGYKSPRALWILGRISAAEGDKEAANSLLRAGMREVSSTEANLDWLGAQLLEATGCLAEQTDDLVKAALCWGAAEKVREECKIRLFPMDRTDYDPSLARARQELDAETFAKAWTTGREAPLAVIDLLIRAE